MRTSFVLTLKGCVDIVTLSTFQVFTSLTMMRGYGRQRYIDMWESHILENPFGLHRLNNRLLANGRP